MNRGILAGMACTFALVLSSCATIPASQMFVTTSMITTGGSSPGTKWEEIPVTSVETKSMLWMVTYIRWEPVGTSAGEHDHRWEWYKGDKFVYKCESLGLEMKTTPYRTWCRTSAAGLGVGHFRAMFFLDNRLMATNEFDIVDVNTKPADANSHADYSPGSSTAANSLVAHCPNALSVARDIGFPLDAAAKGFTSGSVVMTLVLTPESHVHDVHVVSSTDPSFNQAAIDAVTRLKCDGSGLKRDTELRWKMDYQGN